MDARSSFPLTLAQLGADAPEAASVREFVEAVCAAHASGTIPDRGMRDLVRYEAMLLDLPPGPANEAPTPERAPCVIAPHVRILVYGAGLPDMLDALRQGARPIPRPSRGWIVVWRDARGRVREKLLPREEGWMLERFREPAVPEGSLEDDEERAVFAELWKEGVLVHAPSPPGPSRERE